MAESTVVLWSVAASIHQCLQVGLHLGDHGLDVTLRERCGNDAQTVQKLLLGLSALRGLLHELCDNAVAPKGTGRGDVCVAAAANA